MESITLSKKRKHPANIDPMMIQGIFDQSGDIGNGF